MVWGLFPVDPLPGAQKYYIFSKGTYKVGRKDCDVIIQTDRTISRIHAEITVDAMTSWDPSQNMSTSLLSDVCLKDCSRLGTFINKGVKSLAIHLNENMEKTLKNGDLVTFGTGNATFRFCYVPLTFFILGSKLFQVKSFLKDLIPSIGACTVHSWSPECTHVLADESSSVTEDLIDAIVAQKPIVCADWVKVVAEKNIRTEIPIYTPYIPTWTLEGVSIKIVGPEARKNCLAGYDFVIGSSRLYKFGDKLMSLLEVVNAKVFPVDEFCSSSQTCADGANNPVVLVIPTGSVNEFRHIRQLNSLSRIPDMKLIAAILSGHLDPSMMESPSIIVSSSHSTEETIVADSEVEMDTATSYGVAAAAQPEEATKYDDKDTKYEDKERTRMSGDYAEPTSEKIKSSSLKVEDGAIVEKRDKSDEAETSRHQNSDILYSQDLIVRNGVLPTLGRSMAKKNIVDFKCFRKRETRSGNSFNDLIPFSKYPYKESADHGSEENEHVREEKRRKQIEAIAEDLFNNEKVKRRAVASSSLHSLLVRR